MRVLVVGAAGRTGRLVVERALRHGHDVRAFTRASPLDVTHDRLETVSGDVLRFEDVEPAAAGVDAVVFAAGSGGGREITVYSQGIANVLHAMAARRVDKLVAISAAGAFARKDPRISLGFRLMISTVLKPVYDDMERMEQRIAASGVDWTIIRPAGLTDGPLTGRYRLSRDGSLLPGAHRISRADVAALVLKAVETDVYSRQTLLIAD